MGFWQKGFVDGSVVIGTDEDVQKGRASWRESRNDGMYSATVGHNGKVATIKGTGEYWQSDTFSVDFPDSSPVLLARRVMKKLLPMIDNYVRIFQSEKKLIISFSKEPVSGCQVVQWDSEAQWFVAEIKVDKNGSHLGFYRIKDKR